MGKAINSEVKIKCCICNGSGKLTTPHNRQSSMEDKYKIAKNLREEGYSFSEIAALMGYKSKRSITILLNK